MRNLELLNTKINSNLLTTILVLIIVYLAGPIVKTIYDIGYNLGQAIYNFVV